VLDRAALVPIYKRAWVTDGQSEVWFNTDPDIGWLTSLDATPGSLTVVNLLTWDTTTVPAAYVGARPVKGGQITTLTDTGTLAYIATRCRSHRRRHAATGMTGEAGVGKRSAPASRVG
jgi:hypothetical protein